MALPILEDGTEKWKTGVHFGFIRQVIILTYLTGGSTQNQVRYLLLATLNFMARTVHSEEKTVEVVTIRPNAILLGYYQRPKR